MPLLSIDALDYAYPDDPALTLHGLELAIQPGEWVALVGPSGSGKSTLLKLIAGILAGGEGFINWASDQDGDASHSYGYVFQQANLLPWRSVRRNLTLPLERAQDASSHQRVEELLELIGLSGFQDHLPDQLSGGMQQLVGIGRALARDPDLLLLDEPFAALDAVTRERMNQRLSQIVWQTQKTTLLVTHSIEEAVSLADRVIVLTPRPARVYETFVIKENRPRPEAFRASKEFFEYANAIRATLREAMQSWLKAKVVSGEGRGKTLGFPTLNLALTHLPYEPGVYAAWVRLEDIVHPAALHIGPKSTFGGRQTEVEVFLLDTDLKTRPQSVELQVLDFVRTTLKFDSAKSLSAQMAEDVRRVREVLARKKKEEEQMVSSE